MQTMGAVPNIPGFQIVELLYSGTKTLVYRAIRSSDRESVVIKLLKHSHPRFNDIVQFRNQYTISKDLTVPGIIHPYSLEPYQNGYALVLEDYGGISLKDYSIAHPLDVSSFLVIAVQIADVLQDLYQQRIIHKDLKPANILINPQTKQVKITDFSIASLLPREVAEIQSPAVLEGTLAYLSPEQTGRMNRGIDYRSDFYSLGVTFFELLTKQLPFEATDPVELVHCHIAKQPTAVHELDPEIPFALSAIVAKLMAKNAEDRYQSALGLKHDLEHCLSQYKETGTIGVFSLGQRDRSDRFLIPEKLYGRETEVQALLAAFDRVASGTTELTMVAGFSGIGKTAVVNEVHKPIVRQRGYFIRGKFDQFQRNIPLSAFVQALRDLVSQLLCETDVQLENWQQRIRGAVGENGQILIEVIPELETIIGKQSAVPELNGAAAQNRFNLVFQKFIQVFTLTEHPLVIFLDDLQWSDSASLNLMQVLLTESVGCLLLIAAYRDNEVSATHPFMLTVEAIQKAKAVVTKIELAPLTSIDVNQLVADTLSCPSDVARSLSELIYQKAQGNPFFTAQFLKALHDDSCITFNQSEGYWQCDVAQIRSLSLTDDLVQWMANQLQKLPPATQEVLKLAACIGNQFDLATLAIVLEKSPAATAVDLWKALQEELILPITETYKFYSIDRPLQETPDETNITRYKFLHDRVQQAAYWLIPENQKQATHLKIGRLLLKNTIAAEQSDRLFDIVNQLNVGASCIEQVDERYELAQLNLTASRKAKTSTAYIAALDYARQGVKLLDRKSWKNQYNLTVALYQEWADVEALNGNFEQAKVLVQELLEQVQTPLEEANAYSLLITQYTLRSEFSEAIQIGRKALQLLGIILPEIDLSIAITKGMNEINQQMNDRLISELIHQPKMVDAEKQLAMKILCLLEAPTYLIDQDLWAVAMMQGVKLSLEYGHNSNSAIAYAGYGLLLSIKYEQYQLGYEFGNLAVQLSSQFTDANAQCLTSFIFGAELLPWVKPIAATTAMFDRAFQRGLDAGNFQFASFSVSYRLIYHFCQGEDLETLTSEIDKYLPFIKKTQHLVVLDTLIGLQTLVLHLNGKIPDFTNQELSEQQYLQNCHDRQSFYALCPYFIFKSQILYLNGQPEAALEQALAANRLLFVSQGKVELSIHNLYYSLSLTALHPTVDAETQAQYWNQLELNQKQMKIWADSCPENFQHKYLLVNAEIARLKQHSIEAANLYDDVIALTKAQGFLQEEALVYELAAKFYLGWGKERIAQDYLINAYYAYTRWGAQAKLSTLEQQYPYLLAELITSSSRSLIPGLPALALALQSTSSTSESSSTSSSSTSVAIDLATILKASQALSSEIELDRLLSTLLKMVLENAGATRCAFILNEEQDWILKATASNHTSGNYEATILTTPLAESSELPTPLINSVKRSLQSTVITDATLHPALSIEPTILKHQAKSVLCQPILHQGKLLGLLYLENNLTVGAFTRDRLEVLNLLCAQAAISLENARLYRQSQQALETLQHAQLQLVQAEKMSALGNLIAGVAHEINNPVGFIAGNIQPAREHIQDLFHLIELYQQAFPNPGARIEDELEMIDLSYLHEDLTKLLNSMKLGVDRIQTISTSLRIFSRADCERPQPFDLHEGLDSTLLILKHRLKANEARPEIQIIKNYGQLPLVECCPGQLNQVFMNILANAIDALEESNQHKSFSEIQANPNQITIQTTCNQTETKIQIKDNGVGMPDAVKQRIFDHLFTTKAVGKGTGLGLSIARQIVIEKHRGSLEVNSEIGRGTEFVITVPNIASLN